MEIKLLSNGYRKDPKLYADFLHKNLNFESNYFSDDVILIEQAPSFPIYIGEGSEQKRKEYFHNAIKTLSNFYIETPRDIHLNGRFWHSLFVGYKGSYIMDLYPKVMKNQKEFNNIVLKKFDWENYIYKSVLAAEYFSDAGISNNNELSHYIDLLVDNLDLYNYILKYSLFRNSDFVVKLLSIIDKENISSEMKAKIKHPSIDGKDLRYGRQVIFELNKSYPVIMSPSLSEIELNELVLETLEKLLEKYPIM